LSTDYTDYTDSQDEEKQTEFVHACQRLVDLRWADENCTNCMETKENSRRNLSGDYMLFA